MADLPNGALVIPMLTLTSVTYGFAPSTARMMMGFGPASEPPVPSLSRDRQRKQVYAAKCDLERMMRQLRRRVL